VTYFAFVPLIGLLLIAGDLDVTTGTIIAGAAPLVYATIGETFTEKAGVVNLSLDGSLLLSAMAGFAGAKLSGSVIVGFLLAAAVSAFIALIIAYASIELSLNQIAVGFVLFLLATKLSALLGAPFVREPGPAVPKLEIPLLAEIHRRHLLVLLQDKTRTRVTGGGRATRGGFRPGYQRSCNPLLLHSARWCTGRHRRRGVLAGSEVWLV